MRMHTVVVDGPLALRMRRLDAACAQVLGLQILTLPLLAARLAESTVIRKGGSGVILHQDHEDR